MFLVPLEAGLGAVDTDVEIVFLAGADLRRVQHALGAALETEEDVAVIVQFASWHENGEVRA